MPREKLIELYLNNSAWINTYDQHEEEPKTSMPSTAITKLTSKPGGCSDFAPANLPDGMWLSHEIIIGGEAGRNAMFNESKPIPVIDGCAKP